MPESIRVWDPLVRIFHWSLVGFFTFSWITGGEWDDPHEISGYIIAGLLTFRLIWGLVGSHYARFRHFVHHPRVVVDYLGDIVAKRERRHIGHNPAGGAMVVMLMIALAATAFTGWLQTTDMFWGVEWMQETHGFLADGVMVLVVAHLAGVFVASRRHGENLPRAMITGKKRAPSGDDLA
jgi:cytochrome b